MNTEPVTDQAALVVVNAAQTAPAAQADVFHQQLLDNELWRWGAVFVSIILGYAIGKLLAYLFARMGERAKAKQHRVRASLLDATGRTMAIFGVVFGLYIGQFSLSLPEGVGQALQTIITLLFTLSVGLYAWRMVDVITEAFRSFAVRTENKMDDMLVPILRTSLRVTVAVFLVVQIIQIFSDKQVTSILAGLGIGGLAVALAAQDSIKNIFGSIVIFADKPFLVGERVVVDSIDGVVEEVGIRSTRIRTLTGHLVTIPNGELANKNIENIGKRPSIRRTIDVTITYDTPPEKVQRAVKILEEILAAGPFEQGRPEGGQVRDPDFIPKVFFNDFNAESLNIFVIYWYIPADYWAYMAYSQWFNFELLRRYNEEGIDFAFPTQTVYLAGDPKRPLDFGLNGAPGAGMGK